tara:strand:- start:210 stop:419 length:210 start_codon:yes stop_codon:yes gene_type:complete
MKKNNGRAGTLSDTPSTTIRWNTSEGSYRIYKTHNSMGVFRVFRPTSRSHFNIQGTRLNRSSDRSRMVS